MAASAPQNAHNWGGMMTAFVLRLELNVMQIMQIIQIVRIIQIIPSRVFRAI
jgi:hypothetical protein